MANQNRRSEYLIYNAKFGKGWKFPRKERNETIVFKATGDAKL